MGGSEERVGGKFLREGCRRDSEGRRDSGSGGKSADSEGRISN